MSCSALSLTLAILSSLLAPDVIAVRLPLAGNNDINTIESRILLEHNEDLPRSLEMEDFTLSVAPTSGRVSSPTFLRLYPLSAKPPHPHANLPLRFGRDSEHIHQTPKSTINLPQRFGRSQHGGSPSTLECSMCRRGESLPSATLPQRFGRRNLEVGKPIIESPSIRDRTQDYDYIIETVQEKDKASESKTYINLY